MLEYMKTILQKVSFDAALFERELRKALVLLHPSERSVLRDWCYQQFLDVYKPLLDKYFHQPVYAK
ncbi:hypothetical protein [Thermonema rossianum]|uniref:hypothetical protein n=1 Tax=Thermonema rossianum TaxID=55505 RepID=UPI00056EBD8F|nr:hypothetical protein [Thermonema rossianum]